MEEDAEVHDAIKRVLDEKRRKDREMRGPDGGGWPSGAARWRVGQRAGRDRGREAEAAYAPVWMCAAHSVGIRG